MHRLCCSFSAEASLFGLVYAVGCLSSLSSAIVPILVEQTLSGWSVRIDCLEPSLGPARLVSHAPLFRDNPFQSQLADVLEGEFRRRIDFLCRWGNRRQGDKRSARSRDGQYARDFK